MDEDMIIDYLEDLIERFGIRLRYEPINTDEELTYAVGGLCLLRGEHVLIINFRVPAKDRIRALAVAVKHFDLDQLFIRPVLRELLGKIPEQ